jgi:hypothetical protein
MKGQEIVKIPSSVAVTGTAAVSGTIITTGTATVSGTVASTIVVAKTFEAITDWTAVAAGAIGLSAELDCSLHGSTALHIQGGLSAAGANAGARFVVQVSSLATGRENWADYVEFVELVGTAVKDDLEGTVAAGATSITLTSQGFAALTKTRWMFIKDATLADSELVQEKSQATDSITLVEGTTNTHANTADITDIAFSKVVILDSSVVRARLMVDNISGAVEVNFNVRATKVTSK